MSRLTTAHLAQAYSALEAMWETRDLPVDRHTWADLRMRALDAMINLKVYGLSQPVEINQDEDA
jgi:hypothetical protein